MAAITEERDGRVDLIFGIQLGSEQSNIFVFKTVQTGTCGISFNPVKFYLVTWWVEL